MGTREQQHRDYADDAPTMRRRRAADAPMIRRWNVVTDVRGLPDGEHCSDGDASDTPPPSCYVRARGERRRRRWRRRRRRRRRRPAERHRTRPTVERVDPLPSSPPPRGSFLPRGFRRCDCRPMRSLSLYPPPAPFSLSLSLATPSFSHAAIPDDRKGAIDFFRENVTEISLFLRLPGDLFAKDLSSRSRFEKFTIKRNQRIFVK